MSHHDFVFAMLGAAAQTTRRLDRSLSAIKGISFSEYQLLACIYAQPNNSSTRVDLADSVGLTPSGVTRALKPLEKLGFVETIKDERDARRSLATLTPEGIELVTDAAGVVDDTLNRLGNPSDILGSDQERVIELLRNLAQG